MKTIIQTLKKACVIFTVLAFVFAAVIAIMYSDNPNGANLSAARMLFILPASICFAAAGTVRKSEKTGQAAKIALHALLCIAGSFLFLVLPAVTDRSGSERLTGFVLCLVIYAAAAPLVIVFSKRIRKAKENSEKFRR